MPISISEYRCPRIRVHVSYANYIIDSYVGDLRAPFNASCRTAGEAVCRLFMLDFSIDRPIGWNLYAFSINALNDLD